MKLIMYDNVEIEFPVLSSVLKNLKLSTVGCYLFLGTLATMSAACQMAPTSPKATITSVTIRDVSPLGGTVHDGYRIHFSYEFSGLPSVWIRGVGQVKPSGELTYVIREAKLVFRTSKDGTLLASVDVKPTAFPQSPPHPEEFPETNDHHFMLVKPDLSIQQDSLKANIIILDALKKLMKTTPTPCRPDDEGCWLTPWKLATRDANRQGELSVMVSFKDNKGQAPTTVSFRRILREGYIGDPNRDYGGALVEGAGEVFLDKLRQTIKDLSMTGDHQ